MGRRPSIERTDWGKHFMVLRERAGFTLHGLAAEIGEASVTVQNWERRGKIGKFESIPKVAEALGVTVDELLGVAPIKERRGKMGVLEKSLKEASTLKHTEQKKVAEWVSAYVKANS